MQLHIKSSESMIPLSEVRVGQRAQVREMNVEDGANQRLMAFGLAPGCEVYVTHVAPLGDPIAIRFGSQSIMVRRADAGSVKVDIL